MHDGTSGAGRSARIEIEDDFATIVSDRPEKRNAMNDALIDDLDQFFRQPHPDVKAVILRGEGVHFCAGPDLAEHEHREPIGMFIIRATGIAYPT